MEELNNGKISIRTRRLSAELCSIRNEETGKSLCGRLIPRYGEDIALCYSLQGVRCGTESTDIAA